MPISATEAAEIAVEHGLDPTAAVALRDLADDVDHADELAEMFASSKARIDQITDQAMGAL